VSRTGLGGAIHFRGQVLVFCRANEEAGAKEFGICGLEVEFSEVDVELFFDACRFRGNHAEDQDLHATFEVLE
jgi:hypothetical protein